MADGGQEVIDTSRRSFLRGVLSLGAAAVVLPKVSFLPVIVGDGIHDDAPGLNALFRGEPVNILADGVRLLRNAANIELSGGKFALGSPLVALGDYIHIHDVHMIALKDMECLLQTRTANGEWPNYTVIERCRFDVGRMSDHGYGFTVTNVPNG